MLEIKLFCFDRVSLFKFRSPSFFADTNVYNKLTHLIGLYYSNSIKIHIFWSREHQRRQRHTLATCINIRYKRLIFILKPIYNLSRKLFFICNSLFKLEEILKGDTNFSYFSIIFSRVYYWCLDAKNVPLSCLMFFLFKLSVAEYQWLNS